MQILKDKAEEYREKIRQQKEEMQKRIIGLSNLIDSLFICFYSHSERDLAPHILVEGKVGKGKTITLRTFTQTIGGAKFKRIQFSPDIQPIDLIRTTKRRPDGTFEFHPGPLIANLVLADEINRAHEKTRATLLEGMGEGQVTLEGETYQLDKPFFVMATENPIDVEGTFLLGAAQLDRFMMKIYTEPLSEEEEIQIAKTHQEKAPQIKKILEKEEVLEIRNFIRENVFVSSELRRTMVRIVRALRPEGGVVNPEEFYLLPEGERGYLFLERGVKVKAFLEGRNYVILDDIEALAFPILNHRIGFRFKGETSEIISKAIKKVREDEARKF